MKYHDIDGNEVSLSTLVCLEPEWAVSRLTVLNQLLSEALPIVERSEVNVYPESLSVRIKINIPGE